MEIRKLNDKNTYNFANLPLIGQLLEDEKNLPSIMENIESMQGILRIFFVSLSLNFRIDSFGREQMDKALV